MSKGNVQTCDESPAQYSKLYILLVAGGQKEINIDQFNKFIDLLTMYKMDRKSFYDLVFKVFNHDTF